MIDTNDSEGDTIVCQLGNFFFFKLLEYLFMR